VKRDKIKSTIDDLDTGVDESSEWDFIKVILTKNQGRGKRNKK